MDNFEIFAVSFIFPKTTKFLKFCSSVSLVLHHLLSVISIKTWANSQADEVLPIHHLDRGSLKWLTSSILGRKINGFYGKKEYEMNLIGICGDNCQYCLSFIAIKNISMNMLEKVKDLWVRLGLRDNDFPDHNMACQAICLKKMCIAETLHLCKNKRFR